MDAAKVIMHVVKGNRGSMIRDLFRKGIGQASEAPHPHAHGKVLAFDVGGRNMLRISLFILLVQIAQASEVKEA